MAEEDSRRYRYIHYVVDHCLANWVVTDPNRVSPEKRHRNYQAATETPYVYLCGGRSFLVKKNPYGLAIGLTLITAGILYWVFEAPWAWHHQSPAVVIIFSYLWVLTLCFLVKASTSDPGLQPKNIHLPFDSTKLLLESGPDEYFDTISLPYYSNRTVGASVKYCATCHIWRTPRMSHCLVCNVCVQNHDHHCVYINNCVGAGNYRFFLWFLLTTVITCFYLGTFMFLRCSRYRRMEGYESFADFVKHSPVSLLLGLLSCVGVIYPLLLLLFHTYLTANNITTREYLNNARGNPDYVNVFDTHSILKNLAINWLASPYKNKVYHPRDTIREDLSTMILPPLSSFKISRSATNN